MNKFTIIIPSYNEAEKLDASLSVILDQIKLFQLNCQVIVIDDSSTDLTDNVISKYKAKVEFYRTEENSGGAGVPRNLGLKNVTSEYVIFYDVGDVLDLSCINDLLNSMEISGAELCIAKHIDIGPAGEISHPLTVVFNGQDHISNLRLTPHLISNPFCWSKIYRVKWLREHGVEFGNVYCGEDKIFTWTTYLLAKKIYISNTIMYGHKFFGQDINRMLQRNIKLLESLIEIDKIMRIRFDHANLLGLYFSRLIKRDIFGIMLAEDSIKLMESNGDLNNVLEIINEWLIDLFLEAGIKVNGFLSEDEILIGKKNLKDFDLLCRSEELNEILINGELSRFNNFIIQQVNANIKYKGVSCDT